MRSQIRTNNLLWRENATHGRSTRSRLPRFTLKSTDENVWCMQKHWDKAQVRLSSVRLRLVWVNIPAAHHMTASHTLDPAMCSLMRANSRASFPTEITQKTCRFSSHLSWGIALCTTNFQTAAWHHFTDNVSETGNWRFINYSLSVRGDHQAQDLQQAQSNPAERRHHAIIHTIKNGPSTSGCSTSCPLCQYS